MSRSIFDMGPPGQAVWLDYHAYAAALLAKTPQPSDADIDAAMTNLCRCGTYSRVRAAIHRAAAAMKGGAA